MNADLTLHVMILATTWILVLVSAMLTYARVMPRRTAFVLWQFIALQLVLSHLSALVRVPPPEWRWLWALQPYLPYAQLVVIAAIGGLISRTAICPRGQRCPP